MPDRSSIQPSNVEKKRGSWSWLQLALHLRAKLDLGGRSNTFWWALLVGVVGALVALVFGCCTHLVQDICTGTEGESQYMAFAQMPDWMRIVVLGGGGLLAGLTLLFTHRYVPAKATEYMEAIALGNGVVPAKPSLLRSLSAVFTVGTGAAIGREGPLVQAAAVAASAIGRYFRIPTPRLRLMVACAAAAGLSAAFHTPLAGGLFVCEIVLGTLTIDLLAPLLVASCAGYFTLSCFINPAPIYQVANIVLPSDGKFLLSCILLAIIASVLARGWLGILKVSRRWLNGRREFLPIRMCLAGCAVGAIAMYYPQIVGNGAIIINGLMHQDFSFEQVAILFGIKVLAVALFFGVGAVGGVLTPSLTLGGVLGFLFSCCLTKLGITGDHAVAFSLIGMAAFFTTSASAPITSLVLVIEFTMAGNLMFPLIVAVLVSHGVARLMKAESMYHDSLAFGPRTLYNRTLDEVRAQEIARKAPPAVQPQSPFSEITKQLIKNPAQVLFMTGRSGRYIGVIDPIDVLDFVKTPELSQAVLAVDVAQTNLPTIPGNMRLPDVLSIFSKDKDLQVLPVVEPNTHRLSGVVNRTDLYLVLSEIMRREKLN